MIFLLRFYSQKDSTANYLSTHCPIGSSKIAYASRLLQIMSPLSYSCFLLEATNINLDFPLKSRFHDILNLGHQFLCL